MGYSFEDKNNPLVGATLERVSLSHDSETISFALADGSKWDAVVEGDCRSNSWIEHLTVPTDVDGARVTGVKSSGQVDEEESTEYECLRVYNTSLVTDRGEVLIEYRNSSNGYYGGTLRFPVKVSG